MELNVLGKDKLRVLVLSDMHISKKYDVIEIKKTTLKLHEKKYDFIFIVGDIIDSLSVLKSEIMKFEIFGLFEFFSNIAPVYFVTGNHDILNLKGKKKKKELIENAVFKTFFEGLSKIDNVEFLNNKTADIGANSTVSGIILDDEYNLSDGKNQTFEKNSFEFLKGLSKEKTNILLCHYPDVLMSLAENDYLVNVDYSIAGHNHNGATQFKFIPVEPFLNLIGQKNRGIITPYKSFRLKDTVKLRGVLKLKNNTILIINPAFKTLSYYSGLERLNWVFYRGYTEIEFTKK